jgi:hypothetical protein
MGGEHDKIALEQLSKRRKRLSKRRKRTFKLDVELTSTNQYLGNFNTNYTIFRNV